MKNSVMVTDLRELIVTKDSKALHDFCKSLHAVDGAEFISALNPAEVWEVIRHASPGRMAKIFSHLNEDLQIELVKILKREDVARLFSHMSPDDRAILFKQIPDDIQEHILPAMAQAEREDIRHLITYPKGSAGAMMTSDYAALPPDLSANAAIDKLRLEAPNKETIYSTYVVDEQHRLIGFISLKDLILASPQIKVREVMHKRVVHARTTEDQEIAARRIQKYNLIALPVINEEGVLMGIITHDDAFDIITQEQTEDLEKLMAISGSHRTGIYLRTAAWTHFKNRVPWIVLLAALGFISGFIVQSFESTLMHMLVLASFMPMLADTGGNTGSQSATLVIRALAMGEITFADLVKVMFKELQVALLLALTLGVLSWGKVMFFSGQTEFMGGYTLNMVGLVIAVALGLQVVTATLIGAFLPLAVNRMKFDPAVVASPALTTIVDITGLIIYFTTVKIMLKV